MKPSKVDADFTSGRNKVASTIVFAHVIKHLYGSGISALIMPDIKIHLNLNRAQFGFLSTAQQIAWWSTTMIAGYLGDRFTNKTGFMLAISMTLMGVSVFLMGIAPGYAVMVVVLFCTGVGPALFHPPAIGELSRRFPDRRGFAISLHGMAANVGEVLGAPVFALFLTFMFWRDLLKLSLGPALITALLVCLLISSRKSKTSSDLSSVNEYFLSLLSLLRNKVLLVLIVTTALRSIGEAGVTAFLPLYLRDDLNYSVATVAIIMSISQVAGIASQPMMGLLSDRIGRKPVLVAGTSLTMLSAFALSLARPGVQLFSAMLLRGAFLYSLHHIFVAAALDAARGVALSTVVSLLYGAGFFGTFSPYAAGVISDRYGIHSAFVYGGVILILPVLILSIVELPTPEEAFNTADK